MKDLYLLQCQEVFRAVGEHAPLHSSWLLPLTDTILGAGIADWVMLVLLSAGVGHKTYATSIQRGPSLYVPVLPVYVSNK